MKKGDKSEAFAILLIFYIVALVLAVFCICHWAVTCRASGCNNDRPSLTIRYCSKHTCIEPKCYEYKEEDEYYCKAHKEKREAIERERQEAYAKRPECAYPDCNEKIHLGKKYCDDHCCYVSDCDNLTKDASFCSVHKCTYRISNSEECSDKKAANSNYCVAHTCNHGTCVGKVIKGSKFCSSHTCQGGSSGCYNEVSSAGEMCSLCQKNKQQQEYSKNRKTKEKSEYPDCDDYDTYEEFMDDWDGFMPNGEDAEDYWEDW